MGLHLYYRYVETQSGSTSVLSLCGDIEWVYICITSLCGDIEWVYICIIVMWRHRGGLHLYYRYVET